MKLHYDLSKDDFIKSLNHYVNHSKVVQKQRRTTKYTSYFTSTVLILLLFYFTGGIDKTRDQWAIFFITIIIYAALITLTNYIEKRREAKRLIQYANEFNISNFLGEQTLELKDDYLEDITKAATTQLAYSAIEKIETVDNFFYIYCGASISVVPFSAFESDSQKAEFLNTLKQKANID